MNIVQRSIQNCSPQCTSSITVPSKSCFNQKFCHIEYHLITAEVKITNAQQAGKAWCGQQEVVSMGLPEQSSLSPCEKAGPMLTDLMIFKRNWKSRWSGREREYPDF